MQCRLLGCAVESWNEQGAAVVDAVSAPQAPAEATVAGGARAWHVSVAFGADTYRNGMDPLAIVHYVSGLGAISNISCDFESVPSLEALDPESCHLTLAFELQTAARREEIEAAFSFVRDDCVLHIVEPDATPADIVALIEAMPDLARLGDILIDAGAISRVQLAQALQIQSAAVAPEASAARLGEILQATSAVSPKVVEAALQKQQKQREGAAAPDDNRFIRVQADRLDAVINLLGELVIAGAGASLLARQSRQSTLIEANAQISRLIEEIRNGTLQLRMVPIGETFSRFRRVVRDTAAELGKDVALEIVGGETELDKSVVERIADPLMHLVRNALDHGLETP